MSCNHPVIQAITVEDFKNQFYRDFSFVNNWVAGTYNTGDQVFYEVTLKFYKCLLDGVTSTPNTPNDWQEIQPFKLISDKDILNAFAEACFNFNSALFTSNDKIKLGYLYLSAHYLVFDLNAGGANGVNSNPISSRSAAAVSVSYSIPQWQLEKPQYSFYTKSNYGVKYLNMIISKLVGNFGVVAGGTNA